jgi:hypothetical protein
MTTYTATGHRWSARARMMTRLHTNGTAVATSAPTATTIGSVGCGSTAGLVQAASKLDWGGMESIERRR